MTNITPYEDVEQPIVVEYCEWLNIPIFAIPNANAMSSVNKFMAIKIMNKLKKQGLKKGIPDLMIPLAKSGYHGLYIEMKRQQGGVVSAEQKKWIKTLNYNGYLAVVCKGADAAIKVIKDYMKEGVING